MSEDRTPTTAGLNEDPNAAASPPPPSAAAPAVPSQQRPTGPTGEVSGQMPPQQEAAARRRMQELTRLRGEVGLLQRLQQQMEQVKEENRRLRRIVTHGLSVVENEQRQRDLSYDTLAREKSAFEEKLREALTEVEVRQGDVRLAFGEAKRVGMQNVNLVKVLDEKEAELEQLKSQLALSDHSHRRTIELLDQSERKNVSLAAERIDAGQEAADLRDRLAKSHNRTWKLEHENETLRDQVTMLRQQVTQLQHQAAEYGAAWAGEQAQIAGDLPLQIGYSAEEREATGGATVPSDSMLLAESPGVMAADTRDNTTPLPSLPVGSGVGPSRMTHRPQAGRDAAHRRPEPGEEMAQEKMRWRNTTAASPVGAPGHAPASAKGIAALPPALRRAVAGSPSPAVATAIAAGGKAGRAPVRRRQPGRDLPLHSRTPDPIPSKPI